MNNIYNSSLTKRPYEYEGEESNKKQKIDSESEKTNLNQAVESVKTNCFNSLDQKYSDHHNIFIDSSIQNTSSQSKTNDQMNLDPETVNAFNTVESDSSRINRLKQLNMNAYSLKVIISDFSWINHLSIAQQFIESLMGRDNAKAQRYFNRWVEIFLLKIEFECDNKNMRKALETIELYNAFRKKFESLSTNYLSKKLPDFNDYRLTYINSLDICVKKYNFDFNEFCTYCNNDNFDFIIEHYLNNSNLNQQNVSKDIWNDIQLFWQIFPNFYSKEKEEKLKTLLASYIPSEEKSLLPEEKSLLLEMLPNEMFAQIFSYLNGRDARAFSTSCKKLRECYAGLEKHCVSSFNWTLDAEKFETYDILLNWQYHDVSDFVFGKKNRLLYIMKDKKIRSKSTIVARDLSTECEVHLQTKFKTNTLFLTKLDSDFFAISNARSNKNKVKAFFFEAPPHVELYYCTANINVISNTSVISFVDKNSTCYIGKINKTKLSIDWEEKDKIKKDFTITNSNILKYLYDTKEISLIGHRIIKFNSHFCIINKTGSNYIKDCKIFSSMIGKEITLPFFQHKALIRSIETLYEVDANFSDNYIKEDGNNIILIENAIFIFTRIPNFGYCFTKITHNEKEYLYHSRMIITPFIFENIINGKFIFFNKKEKDSNEFKHYYKMEEKGRLNFLDLGLKIKKENFVSKNIKYIHEDDPDYNHYIIDTISQEKNFSSVEIIKSRKTSFTRQSKEKRDLYERSKYFHGYIITKSEYTLIDKLKGLQIIKL